MRTEAHIVDTRAIARTLQLFPHHWVVRGLAERDYGMDLQVEIFSDTGRSNMHGKLYESTGCIAHLQLKGTGKPLRFLADGSISVAIPVKTLIYSARFASPFFLVRVDVSQDSANAYFLWLQRYIVDVLDPSKPAWRQLKDDSTITIRIPKGNCLPGNFEKMERICRRPKFLEELVEFSEIYFHLESRLDAIKAGKHKFNGRVLADLLTQVDRIGNLNMLLSHNDCCVDEASIVKLRRLVNSFKPTDPRLPGWVKFSERTNLDLLRNSIGLMMADKFVAELEGDAVF